MSSYIGHSSFSAAPKKSDGLIDLWRSVVRHKRLFMTITGTFVVVGGLYILLATPQYRAEAMLRVESSSKPGASISALSDVSGTMSATVSASDESAVLTSRSIVSDAIAQTGAQTSVQTGSHFPLIGKFMASRHVNAQTLVPPFLGLSGYAWGGELLKPGVFTVPEASLGDKFRVVTGEAGQYTLYDKDGEALAQGRVGQLVSFSVSTPDGNAPGELRIDTLRARPGVEFTLRSQSAQTVYENVNKALKASVASQSSALHDPSIMSLSYQADSPLAAQMLVNTIVKTYLKRDEQSRAEQAQLSLNFLRGRLPGLKADLESAENRLNDYRTKTSMVDMGQQGTALITRLSTLADTQTRLQLQLDEQKQKFRPDSPTYQAAASQLDQVNRQIQELSDTATKLPSIQREYVRLARDVAVSTQLYTSVLTNAQQLEVAAASTAPGVGVVDWAITPEKQAWPRNAIVLLGSILGGLFVSAATVHLISLKRKELRTPEEIDYISHVPRLAVVAQSPAQLQHSSAARRRLGTPAKLLAANSPTDPGIEALRSLRSSMKALLETGDLSAGKVILFTGPTQGVGKSFVSSNFAYLLAETHASVVLIDADMRQGRLRHLLKERSGAGLAEVLEGTARVEEAIVKLDQSNLSVLNAGLSVPANPSELLGRPAFQEMLAKLRETYDYVVIDSPPVLPVSDALSIASQDCDLVLLVSRADHTGARQLEETIRRLENVGARVGGHIFNGFLPGRYGERDEYGLYLAHKLH
ncbi:polysaccharide biosynthesis tyrosine autokinase [Caballeronia sp. LjRoot29]|uniref:polysaccharide biosynthesis tyrosine autokinase n=1 Tax=Caballeronia sp. LjRoot29 TaxID=3342315 RepID=UPI003ECF44E3